MHRAKALADPGSNLSSYTLGLIALIDEYDGCIVADVPDCSSDALINGFHAHVLVELLPGLVPDGHHLGLITPV